MQSNMDRRKKNGLMVLIYTVLILLCFFMVAIVDQLHGPKTGTEEPTEQTAETGTKEETKETEEAEERTEIQEEETETQPIKEQRKKDQPKEPEETETEEVTEPEEEYKPPLVVFASDIHYFSPELTDYGEAFEDMMKLDDGKLVNYIPQIMDAFTAEMEELKPDAVVLSGDLTLNGEKAGHEALAEKLRVLEDKGIKALIIPGNHDINNYHSASYFGDERKVAPIAGPEEFYEIYREFGYDQAVSRDEASLSYVYELDKKNWLLMLDSAEYEPLNKVGGRIREKTLEWMKQQLDEAERLGVHVIPVAHHNLLKESILYPLDCTLENSQEVIGLLESYRLPLYISGHMHLQRIKKQKPEPGEPEDMYHINEIVSDSFAIPPCQYGILRWSMDNRLTYTTKETDVEGWARDNGITDENLLHFTEYGREYLTDVITGQIYNKISNLPEDQTMKMARLYGELNQAYCAGTPVNQGEIKSTEAFKLWMRNLPDSQMLAEIDKILRDTGKDHNSWEYVLEEKEPAEEKEAAEEKDSMEEKEPLAEGQLPLQNIS